MAKGDPPKVEQDLCGACGWPLICCPGTIRRFVRCCAGCTHRTAVDVDYEAKHSARPKKRTRKKA